MGLEHIQFFSDRQKLAGTIAFSSKSGINNPSVLFLHGSGKSSGRSGFFETQEFLSSIGINSLTFDTQGVGESSGNFEDGSLKNRLHDAERALSWGQRKSIFSKNNVVVVGFSMGTHVAVRLIEKHQDTLATVLIGAVVYAQAAEDKRLNQEFSDVIRMENSWCDSPIFSIFQSYKGGKLLIYGEYDPIPNGVKEKYRQGLTGANDGYVIIPRSSHGFIYGRNEADQLGKSKFNHLLGNFLQRYLTSNPK